MSKSFILLVAFLLLSACAMPVSYYTDPNSAGYTVQGLGGICDYCGKQFNMSGYQLQNVQNIKCPYCGGISNTKKSAARWVEVKNKYNQDIATSILIGAIQGTADGLENRNNSYVNQPSAINQQRTQSKVFAGCSSDFSCGSGNVCVKAPFESTGTCMKSVDSHGLPTHNAPRADSINVNTEGQCKFDTDCAIGFRCDSKYKACVK